jgi:hypothetical protein
MIFFCAVILKVGKILNNAPQISIQEYSESQVQKQVRRLRPMCISTDKILWGTNNVEYYSSPVFQQNNGWKKSPLNLSSGNNLLQEPTFSHLIRTLRYPLCSSEIRSNLDTPKPCSLLHKWWAEMLILVNK